LGSAAHDLERKELIVKTEGMKEREKRAKRRMVKWVL